MKKVCSSLAVFVVSLVLFLLVGELLLRVYLEFETVYDVEMARYSSSLKAKSDNPAIGHVHKPGKRVELMGVFVETNSDGLRDREYPVAKGEFHRIIFLGDSVTFGWGVPREATFEARLEATLDAVRPTEILNFGVGNYNTEQQVSLFLEKGLKYDPDQVVVFYFINDAEPLAGSSKWAFLANSRMLTFIWSRTKAFRARTAPSMSYEAYYKSLYRDESPGWLATQAAFQRLRDACREESIVLQTVILPELHDLESYPFIAEHRKVATLLGGLGIPHLDLSLHLPAVEDAQSLWVARDDAHPNEKAHRWIADRSAAFLREASL